MIEETVDRGPGAARAQARGIQDDPFNLEPEAA